MAALFALLNAPFWWLGRTSFFYRPWFNVDLLLPLLVATRSRAWACGILGIVWTLDLAVSQALAWHFHSAWEFIRSIEFMPAINVAGYASIERMVLAVPFVLSAVLALWAVKRSPRPKASATLVLVAVAAADILNGSTSLRLLDHRLVAANLASSATQVSIRSMMQPPEELRALPAGSSMIAKADAEGWARMHPDRGILLVLVESMGRHRDARVNQWLRSQLVDASIDERFRLIEADVPFRGATTSGELRELCNMSGNYRLLTAGPDCLPSRLVSAGWNTAGFHGFSHRMFMRDKWWPIAGIQHAFFAEEMDQLGGQRCAGAFAGTCDAEVIRRAALDAGTARHFAYVLSLNSHLPVPAVAIPADLESVCRQALLEKTVCRHTAIVGKALAAIRRAVMESRSAPLFVVVGDHAPPFVELSSREQFSAHVVPGFALVPRE